MENFTGNTGFVLLLGYLLGSIPFGLIIAKLGGAGDIRDIGSGNIGATNVLRTGRKGLAVATLLLDLAKGLVAVWIADSLSPGDAQLAGAGAILGHLYPLWLKFKGGKGVATFMGVALGLDLIGGFATWMAAIYAALWIGTILVTRISSLGGLVAAASVPISAWAFGRTELVPLLAALALLIVWKHKDNIGRLLRGEEPRVGKSKATAPDG
jgi:acyl phosphate:glycerol-3-phosphate acyltransferase